MTRRHTTGDSRRVGPRPARLHPADTLRVGATGLRTRPMRVFLSAVGIAIGIAAMVAVLGISASGQEHLDRRLDALGTNLLRVSVSTTPDDPASRLPDDALGRIRRIGPVTATSATATLERTSIYRNDLVPKERSGGISVATAQLDLPTTLRAQMASGTWLNEATAGYPAVVLGDKAARWLGVGYAAPGQLVYLGGQSFAVVGILQPVPLAPELDLSALVGWPVAEELLGFDGSPGTIYVRTYDDAVAAVRAVLAATANPARPDQVRVSRPSDALPAKQAAQEAFAGLILGLAAVALLVGAIGVANTMVISVLERRAEIGLRRALGATRSQIRGQFLLEAVLLALLGGIGGVLLGAAATGGYGLYQGWSVILPATVVLGGLAATVVVGALAGVYPAIRASRLAPTEALAAP